MESIFPGRVLAGCEDYILLLLSEELDDILVFGFIDVCSIHVVFSQ